MDIIIFCGQSNMQGQSDGVGYSNAVEGFRLLGREAGGALAEYMR